MAIGVKLTIAAAPCEPRSRDSRPASRPTRGCATDDRVGGETPEERYEVMIKARWAARENAPDTQIPATARVLAIASGKGGVGKSSVTVTWPRRSLRRIHRRRARRRHLGFSVPRMLGLGTGWRPMIEATTVRHHPSRGAPWAPEAQGGLDRPPRRDEGTALMWRGLMLTKAEQFLRDVHGSVGHILIDMPHGPATSRWACRLLPRTDLIIVTTRGERAEVAIRAQTGSALLPRVAGSSRT